jgi:ATP synthase in type III secretion protein N
MRTAAASTADPLLEALQRFDPLRRVGRVSEAYGTLIRVTGIAARIGEMCELRDAASGQRLMAEVVGIGRGLTLLTPLGTLEGISAATEVICKGRQATVGAGTSLLGRVVDALGNVIDGQPAPGDLVPVPIHRDAPDALVRTPICRTFPSGVRAIDAVLTAGEGQRVGVFAAAGGGKSTLLGMLARGASAEINVIILVGERGREVREFIDDNLGPDGLRKSVVVVATSDRPALERARAAHVGTAIAEYFRGQGRRVLLLVDSVTRFARALRDVGLAIGEPPVRRGYPPSVFSALPRLFERSGNDARGSITAFYTVLLEEEEGDPIGDEVRSILDGHIYLSRKLAESHHFPAIDILSSASRTMRRVAEPQHLQAAANLRQQLSKFQEMELLVQIGEYKAGTDPEADEAIRNINRIRQLLQQPSDQLCAFDAAVTALSQAVRA